MKFIVTFLFLSFVLAAYSQEPAAAPKTPATLKSVLLQELCETHNQKDWFVSSKEAVTGVTAEQSGWKDGHGNHSVGQLAYHIAFWDLETLAEFKGEKHPKFEGKNDDTFDKYDPKEWDKTVMKLDMEMTEWEKAIEAADDATLQKWAPTIAKIAEHRAYHIGEIVMVRKEQGSWNPEQGVK